MSEQGSTDTAARDAQINGQPPRISPLPPEEFTEEALAITGRLRQIGSGRPPPTNPADVPEVVAIMLRHPGVYTLQIEAGLQLGLRGAFCARDRELLILRIGWLCRAPYEWGEHVKKGKALGLSPEQIEAITAGSTADGWTAHEAALLRAVEELYDDAMISDATWAVLAETLDVQQLIELPILVGQYQALAYSQNSLRLRLNAGNVGLSAR